MARVYEDITAAVGHKPLVRLKRMAEPGAEVLAKMESMNPGGSVNDHIAVSMLEVAEKQGLVCKDTVLIEPTSGNTGIVTGGTITGYGDVLKCKKHELRVVAVELTASSVLSCGEPEPHKIQGIGVGFVPDVLDTSVYDV